MDQKRKSKRKLTWGLGIVIADSDGKKVGRVVKIPKRLLDQAQPISKSAFLDPQYEKIMRCVKSYKPRKRY